jgi:hypothetical protein
LANSTTLASIPNIGSNQTQSIDPSRIVSGNSSLFDGSG